MRIKAKYSDCSHLTKESLDEIGYFPQSIIHIKKGNEYEVYAISFIRNHVNLQIIDDLEGPFFMPAIFFDVIDSDMPSDWICNNFSDERAMVIGPDFIAKDVESYDAMVELEPPQIDLFWQRVQKLK